MKDVQQFIQRHRKLFNLRSVAHEAGLNYDRLHAHIKNNAPLRKSERLRLKAYLKYLAGIIHETVNEEATPLPESIRDCAIPQAEQMEREEIC